jgi:mannose-1-phosphate guanylyltransferase
MYVTGNTWALVLAAGDGSRLRALTTTSAGVAVPKQFCSLHDGPTLLDEALDRARAVTSIRYTCSIVAAHQRRWWQTALRALPTENVIVQPENRGTAHGILLPLLHILERDPDAQLIVLPSDHHVVYEAILTRSLQRATEQLRWRHAEVLMLGIEPEEADPELGYIVPGHNDGRGALTIECFAEKPSASQAQTLISRGGLWNAFILATTAQALLAMFARRMPDVVTAMGNAVRRDLSAPGRADAVAMLYERLPNRDFSRHILLGEESHLRVLPVPSCGWSDLGTPKRVAEALGLFSPADGNCVPAEVPYLSLAAQYNGLRALA